MQFNYKNILERLSPAGWRYITNGLWLLIPQGFAAALSLISMIVFTNQLSAVDFGLYRYILGLSILFGSLTLTGAGQAILQSTAKKDDWYYHVAHRDTITFNRITMLAAAAVGLYYWAHGNMLLTTGCMLIAILQPFNMRFMNALSLMYGRQDFKAGAVVHVLRTAIITGASLAALFITHSISILIGVYLLAQAVTGYLSWLFTKQRIRQGMISEPSVIEKYRGVAKHTSIRNLITGLATRLDSIIIFQQLGAVNLAIFTVATILPDYIKGFSKNIPTLLVPSLSARQDAQTPSFTRHAINGFVLLSILTLAVIAVTPYVYPIIFPGYPEAILYTQILALSFPASVYYFYLSWFQAKADEKTLYKTNLFVSIGVIPISFFGIISFGILGAISARVIVQYITLFLVVHEMRKTLSNV